MTHPNHWLFPRIREKSVGIPRAVEYHGQALPMDREIENREVEALTGAALRSNDSQHIRF
jgi:hypothetical protein